MLVANLDGAAIEAARGMEHRRDYRCPGCGRSVVLHARVDGWVVPHFKHKVDACLYGKGERPEHRAVKRLLCDYYRAKGHEVNLEWPIENRRADVFDHDLNAAFEVEFSSKEARDVAAKCGDYKRHNIRSIWILRHNAANLSELQVGLKITITTPPVLDMLRSLRRCPRGASAAFFAYSEGVVVVFRGQITPIMLYKEYDEYSGGGGYEYSSRSHARLLIADVIRTD